MYIGVIINLFYDKISVILWLKEIYQIIFKLMMKKFQISLKAKILVLKK